MRTVVAMPWRPQPAREAAHALVREWLARHLPLAPVLEVDTAHHPYNLSAVRNEGVRRAEELGADMVVIIDADAIIVPPDSLHEAIAAAVDGRVHMPFTVQRYLTQEETERVLAGGAASTHGAHGNGACYVCTPAAYWTFGGSDERFSGWGGDDDQLVAAASTLVGLERHEGTVWSLWHADERRPVGTAEHRPNALLAQRYWAAIGSPRRMRDLIGER